jgi:glucose-1-phosphate adenylyltransferase
VFRAGGASCAQLALARDTYAIVPAAGRGTQPHELTAWRAKPAVPFGGKHRAIDFP